MIRGLPCFNFRRGKTQHSRVLIEREGEGGCSITKAFYFQELQNTSRH
jgi:hypothetical protein